MRSPRPVRAPSPRARRLAAVLLLVLGGACDGCGGCGGCDGCGSKEVARLVGLSGTVERDFVDRVNQWNSAPIGALFAIGDAVRTGRASSARLELAGGAQLALRADTTIRFLDAVPGTRARRIDVMTGEAEVETGGSEVRLASRIGDALIESGSRVRIRATAETVSYDVEIGRAEIESDGARREIEAGQRFEIAIGGAELERVDAAVVRPAPDAGPPDAGPPDTGTAVADSAPVPLAPGEVAAHVEGEPVRVREVGQRRWGELDAGDGVLRAGSVVRVPERTTVDLRRGDQRARLIGAGEYTIGGEDGALVTAARGRLTAEAGDEELVVQVPGGTIVLRGGAGTRSDLQVTRAGTDVTVRRGSVDVRGSGVRDSLRAGETAVLARAGTFEIGGRGPERADFIVDLGASFTVHLARPPVALGFRLAGVCPTGGVVELMRGGVARAASRGDAQANLLVQAGSHAYQVRCVGAGGVDERAVASGTARVLRDPGLAQLPRTPPVTPVDMDGRRYRVLYQNRLPDISTRWSDAPAAPAYLLHLQRRNGEPETVRATAPRYTFRSGEIAEGDYRLYFEVDGSPDLRSRPTLLTIEYDNAAPTASVATPLDGSFAPGDTVQVSGVTVEGWSVSLAGQDIPLDRALRFAGTTIVPADQNSLAIRLSHRERGVHYYVRRARGY